MTKEETAKILAILKAAYPNTFKNLSTEDARATLNIWATQFISIPVGVVMIAVNKLISTNIFPPTITEVKERIRSLYYEAWGMLHQHKQGISPLDPKTLEQVQQILKVVEPMRTQQQIEPSMKELLSGYAQYLTSGKQIENKGE